MQVWSIIIEALGTHGACALVTQLEVQGSAPREAGARMVVMPDGTFTGTIGGGALEWRALSLAQKALKDGGGAPQITCHALGPELGQCCGGAIKLMMEVFTRPRSGEVAKLASAEAAGPFITWGKIGDGGVARTIVEQGSLNGVQIDWDGAGRLTESFGARHTTVCLFGAGHVGRALMLALAPLPFDVIWCDVRRDAFPAAVPGNVTMVHAPDPAAQLQQAPDGALVVVMTHSHALDLDLVQSALKANRFGYVGVIGSATKRARFRSRMAKAGLDTDLIDRLVCPIGADGIRSKQPAVIAAAVAAELLARDELVKSRQIPVQFAPQQAKIIAGQ